jgi:hypothetical protein
MKKETLKIGKKKDDDIILVNSDYEKSKLNEF